MLKSQEGQGILHNFFNFLIKKERFDTYSSHFYFLGNLSNMLKYVFGFESQKNLEKSLQAFHD